MAREVIREVAVDPPVPPELVVFRRADIQRFIAAARQTVARLEAELDAERQRGTVIDISEAVAAEPRIASGKITTLPPWTSTPADEAAAGVSFFESLREPDAPLIAGAEPARQLSSG